LQAGWWRRCRFPIFRRPFARLKAIVQAGQSDGLSWVNRPFKQGKRTLWAGQIGSRECTPEKAGMFSPERSNVLLWKKQCFPGKKAMVCGGRSGVKKKTGGAS
jgi:hypothetical protein